jgi:hypothetical protein
VGAPPPIPKKPSEMPRRHPSSAESIGVDELTTKRVSYDKSPDFHRKSGHEMSGHRRSASSSSSASMAVSKQRPDPPSECPTVPGIKTKM